MNDILLKQGERKTLAFTYKNAKTKSIIPLTGATFTLVIFSDKTPIITKSDEYFDKSLAINGIVKVTLTEQDLNQPVGTYRLQIKTVFPNGEIDKSNIFSVNISESLFS